MANLVKKIGDRKVYHGLLDERQIAQAEALLDHLIEIIPTIEEELQKKYPKKNSDYAYSFGVELRKLADEFQVEGIDVRVFLDQIREFASKQDNPIDRAEDRKTYEYYYRLAAYNKDAVLNMNWGEWVYLLDIKEATREERLFHWLADYLLQNKMKREQLRLFATGVRLFVKGKDTAVYSNKQLFTKYDLVLNITNEWLFLYEKNFTSKGKEPTEARMKKKKRYQERYFQEVFVKMKKIPDDQYKESCDEIFRHTYLVKG